MRTEKTAAAAAQEINSLRDDGMTDDEIREQRPDLENGWAKLEADANPQPVGSGSVAEPAKMGMRF